MLTLRLSCNVTVEPTFSTVMFCIVLPAEVKVWAALPAKVGLNDVVVIEDVKVKEP